MAHYRPSQHVVKLTRKRAGKWETALYSRTTGKKLKVYIKGSFQECQKVADRLQGVIVKV